MARLDYSELNSMIRVAVLVLAWCPVTGSITITITGVGKRAAETILAEIGVDMASFPPPRTWPPGPK